MSNISFDLSGKIDQQTVDTLSAVKRVSDSLEIPFFVVGASARDFLLKHCYGIEPPRMTRDIDLGVKVADWEQFSKLTRALTAAGEFSPDRREQQRFRYDVVPIDIMPFGPITDKDRRIFWPPEHEIFMNMMGFQEAYEYSITVRLNSDPDIDVKLPTLPGLALMKLISWDEKYPERKKDAEDLLLIMQKYEEAGNFERLYNDEQDLLQEENFDTRLAGIRLLGHDMAEMPEFPEIPFELGFRNTISKDIQEEILEEIHRISYHINPKIWLGIRWLCTYVSIRPGELISTREGNIDLGNGYLFIPHPKEKKPKMVPLLEEDVEVIRTFPRALPSMPFFRHVAGISGTRENDPFGPRYLYKWWMTACGNLGIEGVDLYGGTRHSSAKALRQFCSPEEIKRATMHSTNKAFERYFQIEADNLRTIYGKTRGAKETLRNYSASKKDNVLKL